MLNTMKPWVLLYGFYLSNYLMYVVGEEQTRHKWQLFFFLSFFLLIKSSLFGCITCWGTSTINNNLEQQGQAPPQDKLPVNWRMRIKRLFFSISFSFLFFVSCLYLLLIHLLIRPWANMVANFSQKLENNWLL